MLNPPEKTKQRARSLRREMSLPEVLLWNALRTRPNNLKFRRQHPIGPFVLDFYCLDRGLAVEVDGQSHDYGSRPEQDLERDKWLNRQGIAVLRIAARDVLTDLDAVVRAIVSAAARD